MSPQVGATHQVHPHGRGDNGRGILATHPGDGSPPRAWGQLTRGISDCKSLRFTPTGVGTTLKCPYFAHYCVMHLLMCIIDDMVDLPITAFASRYARTDDWREMRINCKPSRLTTSRVVSPAVRISKCCSVFVLQICVTPPIPLACIHFSQSLSRTRAETYPTKMPVLGSSNQWVSSPRTRAGTFSRIITSIL